MAYAKLKPGPRRTSCLTCRQRRKKCDLARPHCERCLKGGFECLGYGDSEPRESARREEPNVPTSSLFHSDLSAVLVQEPMESPEPVDLCTSDPSHSQQLYLQNGDHNDLDRVCTNREASSSLYGSRIFYNMTGPVPWAGNAYTGTHSRENSACLRPQNQNQLTYRCSPARYTSSTIKSPDKVFDAQSGETRLSTTIRTLFTSIPPSVDATHIMRDAYVVHVIGECE
ncbi:hypothetical protein B0J17DRAFT_432579 [Rhizoctonia solani]|nr:hypothetical protein B0J17DRAFT_432579 [Rhizoctonia solani]